VLFQGACGHFTLVVVGAARVMQVSSPGAAHRAAVRQGLYFRDVRSTSSGYASHSAMRTGVRPMNETFPPGAPFPPRGL